mmetsp:Transcript_57117/g.121395  ORF Transcript_57117/g.121395 Transcript_57117/m.121395 type:complete len:259 (-) Transcript_57117:254-1030(-)
MRTLFDCVSNHLCLRLSSGADDGDALGVESDGAQSDGDNLAGPNGRDASEVARRSGLGHVVELIQARRAVVVAALAIKGNMAIRAYAPHDETDASQSPNLGFVVAAPLIHLPQHPLLHALQPRSGLPHTKREIDEATGPNLLHRRVAKVVFRFPCPAKMLLGQDIKTNFRTIHEQCLVRVEPKALDVVLLHVVVEAVVLLGRDGVEFVDLDEGKACEDWLLRLEAIAPNLLPDERGVPLAERPLHPLDEVLGSLSCGQ